ncbi:MAG: DNA-binding domain-containing protein [Candidatus Paceibacterota bacterium]
MNDEAREDATRELDVVQRWMQAVITHPLGIASGVESPEARAELDVDTTHLESIVARSKALTSVERLAIYGNAYYARLLECMRDLFPALVDALGEDLFDSFAFSYLQQYPSRSYTLEHLADRFVQFLEETRPELSESTGNEADDSGEPAADEGAIAATWPDFIIDLARLEWTIDQVFDGPGVEREAPLTAERLMSIPADQWADARLAPVVCLRLLAFKYPVNDYYTAFRAGDDAPIPDPQESFAAITRRDYIVRRFELSKPQYELLSALVEGRTVGEAIADVATFCADVDTLAGSLQDWFRIWSVNGFFQQIHLPPDD